jgi:hypothetical protein
MTFETMPPAVKMGQDRDFSHRAQPMYSLTDLMFSAARPLRIFI